MNKEMINHHYPLQAHLYLVALHRFLKWRLPNYSPYKNIGGYIYLFLRGIPSESDVNRSIDNSHIPGIVKEEPPIKMTMQLDKLFKSGNL